MNSEPFSSTSPSMERDENRIAHGLDFTSNRVCKLFGVRYPIVQAGMVWVSGGKLAAASANAGCLGVVGAGSMKAPLLKEHLIKARGLSCEPIAVNLPLLYEGVAQQIEVCLEQGVRIFITSAGTPKTWTGTLKAEGATVVHVVSSPTLALKCQDAGVDAVIAEGFEAGGHNGRDELTTFVLLQLLQNRLQIPLIAAGGIGSGSAIAACLALGADGVQLGTAFAATQESSAHNNFKQAMLQAGEGSTALRMKKHVPVRLLDNPFSRAVAKLESEGATKEQLEDFLGKGRAKRGMLEGDLEEGELEIGQIVGLLKSVPTCQQLVESLIAELALRISRLKQMVSP